MARKTSAATETIQSLAKLVEDYGPRNCALLSRKSEEIGEIIPVETIRYNLKTHAVRPRVVLNYRGLGLENFYIRIKHAKEKTIDALTNADYSRLYESTFDGTSWFFLTAPQNGLQIYEPALRKVENNLQIFRTEPVIVKREFSLLDAPLSKFLPIDMYFKEKPILPYTQVNIQLDKRDIILLSAIESEPTIGIIDIARKVKMHPKTLSYHFHQHVEPLIGAYQANMETELPTRNFFYVFEGAAPEETLVKLAAHPFVGFLEKFEGGAIMHTRVDIGSEKDLKDYFERQIRTKVFREYSPHEVVYKTEFKPLNFQLYNEETGWSVPTQPKV